MAHQRAKWCSDALGGAAEHYATRPRTKWRSGATARGSRSTAHEAARSTANEPHTAPQPRTQAPESDRTATAPIPNNRADHHTTTPLCGTPLRPHRPPPVHSSNTARRPRRSPCGEHLEDTAARARLISAPGEDCVDEEARCADEGEFVCGGWPLRPLHCLIGREGPIDDGALGAEGGGEGVLAPAFTPASAPGRFLVLLDGDLAGEPAPWTVPAPRARSTCSPRRAGAPTCCR